MDDEKIFDDLPDAGDFSSIGAVAMSLGSLSFFDRLGGEHPLKEQRLPLINGVPTFPTLEQAYKAFHDQQMHQLELLKSETRELMNDTCGVDLDGLSLDNLDSLIEREPYNPDVLKSIFCSVQRGFLDPQTQQSNVDVINRNVSGTQIISSGQYGNVFRVIFRNRGNYFVLKTPIRLANEQANGHIHEFFVGLQLNRLQCPNFMYVHGVFKCFAMADGTFPRSGLCLEPEGHLDRYFLLAESVKGQTLYKQFKYMTLDDAFSVYFQLILALNLAWKQIGFTHYDLHVNNIMIHELPGDYYIPYETDGDIIYVKSRLLVKIIDYGFAHVKYKGEDFGFIPGFSHRTPGGMPLDDNPIMDLYRLTGSFAFMLLYEVRFAVFEQFWPLLYRFPSIKQDSDRFLLADAVKLGELLNEKTQENWRYDHRNSSMITNDIYMDVIDFAIDTFPHINSILTFELPADGRSYSCASGCSTMENIQQMLSSSSEAKRRRK